MYLKVKEVAEKWNVSERAVRNYCVHGRIAGVKLEGKKWLIPEDSKKPERKKKVCKISDNLLSRLKLEKNQKIPNGIYHKIQIELTYNSNHIEGSQLTHEETRYIYETNTIGLYNHTVNVDDIVETVNHFKCVDYIIDEANYKLSESFIKQLHYLLKSGTSDSRKDWFVVGDYKILANTVGDHETVLPEDVSNKMKELLRSYNINNKKSLKELLEFHYQFERIHPFQDGNGRVGRLILFKECMRNGITPFIISDDLKLYYYRGLENWKKEEGYLLDTCLTAQDRFKAYLDYFKIKYND